MGNAADDFSRDLNMKQNSNVKIWFQGPAFLWKVLMLEANMT